MKGFLKDYSQVQTIRELSVELTKISDALTEVNENLGHEDTKIRMYILNGCIKNVKERWNELEQMD